MTDLRDLVKDFYLWITVFIALFSIFMPNPYNFVSLMISPIPVVSRYTIKMLKRSGLTSIVDEDLLYLITHMYSVSTGNPPHERLFNLGGVSGKGYGRYSMILNRIASLGKRWGYGHVIATKIQAKNVENLVFRDFLNRFAEAINVGENLETFLYMEHNTMIVSYEADYNRIIESLKILLGIYTAAISSAIFIDVNLVLLSFFLGNIQLIILSFFATTAALAALLILIRKMMPKQNLVHDLRINMPERKLYLYTSPIIFLVAGLTGVYVFIRSGEPAFLLISFGAFLIIPGLIGRRIESKVKDVENYFIIFIRSLGLTYNTLRNYAQSIKSMLVTDLGLLTRHLRKLYSRLSNGIDSKVAMLYFIGETGSEIVRRGIDIFYDSIEAGGDPVKTGDVLSVTIQRILNLRKQREQVARAFQGVIYVLTILVVALAEFVFTLVVLLQQVFSGLGGLQTQIIPISVIEPNIITALKIILIFVVVILNAFAIQFARGGFTGSAWLHASILLILSGGTLLVSSIFSQTIFKTLEATQITSP